MAAATAPASDGPRRRAARALRQILDSRLFRALCEPVRVEIVAFLTETGPADVSTVARHFPQHSSVVSRHLACLHEAGVVRRRKQGRHVFFELDGAGTVERLEAILARFRAIVPLCCPPEQPARPGDRGAHPEGGSP